MCTLHTASINFANIQLHTVYGYKDYVKELKIITINYLKVKV